MELDLRSLAALRVSLGLLVVVDVLMRARDIQAFYTDSGVLPRITLLESPHPTLFDLLMTVGTSWGVAVWFVLLACCGFGMLLGWNTRWCTLGAWVLHTAVKHRNPLILDAGDLEFGLMLWWAIFLPLGARYSLDARRHPEWATLPNAFSSVATTGYVFQLSLMYLFAALNKSDPVWWDSGLALYYFLSHDQFTTDFGRYLSGFGAQLRPLTFLALGIEYAIPVALWMPLKRPQFRLFACALIVALHLAIGLTIHLGLMVFINVLVTVGLWPGVWAEKLLSPLSERLLPALPPKEPAPCAGVQPNRASSAFLVLICLYIAHLNVAVYRNWVVPYPVKFFGYLFRQQQNWKMFAPHPGVEDGWLVAQGLQVSGHSIDLLKGGGPVTMVKPESVANTYPNHRWRLWLLNLVERNDRRVFKSYCLWLAREWNDKHPGPAAVKHITLTYVAEPTPPPGNPLKSSPTDIFEFEVPKEIVQKPNEVYLPLDFPKDSVKD